LNKSAVGATIRSLIGFLVLAHHIQPRAHANGADCDHYYRGLYTWGAEVNSFQPCESTSVYWVSASSWVLDPLKRFVAAQTTLAYKPIYVEFRGHLLDEQVGGFAADYDGLIRISEVLECSATIPDTCRERGQEP
jgi:hypothetical protein